MDTKVEASGSVTDLGDRRLFVSALADRSGFLAEKLRGVSWDRVATQRLFNGHDSTTAILADGQCIVGLGVASILILDYERCLVSFQAFQVAVAQCRR